MRRNFDANWDCLPTPPSADRSTLNTNEDAMGCVTPTRPITFSQSNAPSSAFNVTMDALPTPCSDAASTQRSPMFDEDDTYAKLSPLSFQEEEELLQREHTQKAKRGRGQYTRTNTSGKRKKWLEHIKEYIHKVQTGHLMGEQHCSKACPTKTCNQLVDIRVAKLCAQESFGSCVLFGDWSNVRSNHEAVKHWFQMAFSARAVDPIMKKVTHIDYKVNGISVCGGAWAAFHGITPTTAYSIHKAVMSNQVTWNSGLAKQGAIALQTS